ncbi:MAG TPA: CDP-alcohol phosphatidyltransferase family protein [Chitinophagales bacterium]|nr:CDP-alcohol phosphatidyltransferase family protein [Chitinophagales bacterium]HNM31209.1 CDP-alcohol phosphatidyltransferase family protein [Chitinophagales bacterium]
MSLLGEDKKQKGSIERGRTNILRFIEQPTLLFLCKITPEFVTPNMLTAIGMFGTAMVTAGFWLAHALNNKMYLFIAILGFAINWLGDSLDGRIAYYRNIPRKWFGFTLDCIMDWISLVMMSVGYFIYIEDNYKILVFLFSTGYAWAMLMIHLKYKMTDKYTIDTGLFGPTETRIIICLVILSEIFLGGSIKVFSIVVTIMIMITNIIDTFKTVKIGDEKDIEEKRLKAAAQNV